MTNSLVHYGVKGMRWGVRKEVERVGAATKTKAMKNLPNKSKSQQSSKPNPSTFKNNPNNKNYKPKTSKEYRQEVASNSKKNNYSTSSGSANSGSGASANPYENLSEEELMELVKQGKISKEYAESLLDKKLTNPSPSDEPERKGSKEYQEEVADNSQKNSFQNDTKKPVSEVKKTESWKDKVAKGTKAISDSIKKIGKQAVSSAKNAVESGKKALSKLLNIKGGSTKTTRATDKTKAKKNSSTINYNLTTKTVTGSGNASLKKALKPFGGNSKGWKIQTKK